MHPAILAYTNHQRAAETAYGIYAGYCGKLVPPRVPGMDTVIRLAVRIAAGKTPVEAAAREYVYRWQLAILAPDQCGASGRKSHDARDRRPDACVSVFGTPHTIGM